MRLIKEQLKLHMHVHVHGCTSFMQDGAPCHLSKVATEFLKKNKISVLGWPRISPDLNPIENPWAIMKDKEREREMFYLTTHSTHFIYGYMASDIWLRTILIVKNETRCRHIGYSYRLAARVLLYAPSHRQDNTYHGLCYTSRGALAGTRNSSMGPPHEGSIRRPITP